MKPANFNQVLNQVRFNLAIAGFDALNKQDPNREIADGQEYAKELLYAMRMSAMLHCYMTDASEALQLAVRCQHIQRWKIARASYAMTKPAYLLWRNDLKNFHAATASTGLHEVGYDAALIRQVCALVKKEAPQTNTETQVLQDVVVLVFLAHYLEAFVADHSDYETSKFVDILTKTLRKMSNKARLAALKMVTLPEAIAPLVTPLIQSLIDQEAA